MLHNSSFENQTNATPPDRAHEVPERHPMFYYEHVVFLVEGTLFKVPRDMLSRESDTIRAMFDLPATNGPLAEGSLDEHPIRLDGVAKSDFQSLLTLLFQHPSRVDSITTHEWISILKLATMWDMEQTRTLAIKTLSDKPVNPVDKIGYSRDFNVPQWERPAMVNLIQRSEYLSSVEAERLGWRLTIAFAQARERYAVQIAKVEAYREGQQNSFYHGSPSGPNAEALIDDILYPSKAPLSLWSPPVL